MTTHDPGTRFVLDAASIANFVRLQRMIFGWKQEALAAQAKVSHSTGQRVERGARVRPAQLRKIAVALGKPEDEFLRARVRPTAEQMAANLAGMFAWTEGRVPVTVAPLTTASQLRALLATDALLLDSGLGEEAADDVAELREWLDLASFIQAERAGLIGPKPGRDFRVRRLWRDVLDCTGRIARAHRAVVLAGSYDAKAGQSLEPVRIAIFAIRSRERDPAVGTMTTVWASERVDEPAMFADYFAETL